MVQEKIPKESKSIKTSKAINKPLKSKMPSQDIPAVTLQKIAGNRAIQRLVAQTKQSQPSELEDDTVSRINQERSKGQPLDHSVQTRVEGASGVNLGNVNVHTSSEANQLNQQLNAKAFTTGKDIFFRQGEYQPHSSSGQNLIAHELSHVIQQASGQVPSSGKMQVNPPDDVFEQQADSFAQNMTSPDTSASVQRQEMEEEEPVAQTQIEQEEEEEEAGLQTKHLQRQEEEEEPLMPKRLQRQEEPEEETLP